jgi:3-hydroxybutyryl-CoA dehydrogenase
MVQTICICGAGTMGSGIAQLLAQNGFDTLLYDVQGEMLEKARGKIEKDLQGMVEKNRVSVDQKTACLQRIRFTDRVEDCIAHLVIEAIVEEPLAKIRLFDQLSLVNDRKTIFASNTSSLSITGLAKKIKYPERMIGLHFFNPAPLMKLVEIVLTEYTDKETLETTRELAKQMNKTAVVCRDAPGFIVNHVARPYYLEALKLVEEGLSDFETIDELMEASGFKMGPFRLMDLIGNDINYAVSLSIYEAMLRPLRLKPSPLQLQMLQNGALGRKTGKGYYGYPSGKK